MPFYAGLKFNSAEQRGRAVDGLLTLRRQLGADVPPRRTGETVLLATWNIREFDSGKYGKRCPESLYYIAEILDHFDLIAIEEVNKDLTALKMVMDVLGSWWDVIFTDVTYGRAGNDERMAIVYDKRNVTFSGLAGEVVLPDLPDGSPRQLARTPFVCGFRCGWITFDLCVVHTYYGSAVANEPRRLAEIEALAKTLTSRDDAGSAANVVLLGDFNIFKRTDDTFKALADHGFKVPEALMALPTNAKKDKEYDQIAFLERQGRFTFGKAGVFDFQESVFRDADEQTWRSAMGDAYANASNPTRYYRDWRTYQMSDHLPMWVELEINHTDRYLQYLRDWKPKTDG